MIWLRLVIASVNLGNYIVIAGLAVAATARPFAQQTSPGTIAGLVVDASSSRPLEFVNVTLHNRTDSVLVTGQPTDRRGSFQFSNVAQGEYFVKFSLIGYKERLSPGFIIDSQHKHLNVGTVALVQTPVSLDEVLVAGERSIFNNSIDRKVYNVDQDLMSKAGSASELLQNVPSVQVDIDGNVSLRGSSNVLIMVNGKTSPMMDKSSAEVLQQMPASSIEKIEVITNPSAKYKPEGTAGIINIVLKKNTTLGVNGDLTGNAGNQDRYNGNIRLNFNPGDLNIYGSYGIRKDNRNRINTDARRQTDTASTVTYYNQNLPSYATPLSHIVSLGLDYRIGGSDQVGLSGNYFYNSFTRTEDASNLLTAANGSTLSRYDRRRWDEEYEKEMEYTAYAEHNFPQEDHKLRLEITGSQAPEQEDNRYTNISLIPAGPTTFDNTLIKNGENRTQVALDYSNPLAETISLEAGYAGEFNSNDMDYHAEVYDTVQRQFVNDPSRTNRFLFHEWINAAYVTYKRTLGAFGFLAGLRGEHARVRSNLVTLDSTISHDYLNFYPSLHLSYRMSPVAELQLSYSRRTHRPEGDDFNPFPEYRDPRNVSAGNPSLLPEYIHSIELGCQFQNDYASILPSVYYRYSYNRFTPITRFINDSTLLTTRENLSSDQSGGLEIVASVNVGEVASAHASINGFYETIDASNLGYGERKSITSWSGALTVNFHVAAGSRFEVNSNFRSARLTAQGEYSPTYVVNAGFRQELFEGDVSIVMTAADIFKSLKRQLELDTPSLNQTVINARDSRIFYLGLTYHFGAKPKKAKEEQLHYEDNL